MYTNNTCIHVALKEYHIVTVNIHPENFAPTEWGNFSGCIFSFHHTHCGKSLESFEHSRYLYISKVSIFQFRCLEEWTERLKVTIETKRAIVLD